MLIEEIKKASQPVSVSGTYVISCCELKPFKAKEGFFLQCELTDRTGTIRGIIWEKAEKIKAIIRNKMVVDIVGESTRYNDIPQVVIKNLSEAKEYKIEDFVPSLDQEEINACHQSLIHVRDEIQNETYGRIWDYLVSGTPDDNLTNQFIHCPGSVGGTHHNYIGGLLQHTTQMILTCGAYKQKSNIDMELLWTGCLVHDIGKIDAYEWDIVIAMGDIGRLLHHAPLGLLMLEKMACTLDLENGPELLKLKHIILTHHEGSGFSKPMFPEALAVSMIDNLDAAVNFASMFSSNPDNHEEDTNWTRFCQLTERRYYAPIEKKDDEIPVPDKKPELKDQSDHIF